MKILGDKEIEANVPFEVEFTGEEIDALVLAGLQEMIRESGLPVVAVKASECMHFNLNATQHDLKKEELSVLVNLGFTKVLRDGLDKMDKMDKEKGNED